MKNLNFYIVLVIIISFFSCNNVPKNVKQTLELAGDNKVELQKVIDHYQAPKDSLKLKAAYFLIGNMSNKYSYDTLYIGSHRQFISYFDSINSIVLEKKKELKWHIIDTLDLDNYLKNSTWGVLNKKYGNLNIRSLPIVRDIDVITSDLLIENIDLAFKVWQTKPWAMHVNFDAFCEFILPYRVDHEPLQNWRSKLYNKYSWIDTMAHKNNNVLDIATMLNDSLQWFKNNKMFQSYPDLGISEMYKAKYGTCVDQNNLTNYVLRSQGVPAIHLFKNKGTSWSAVLDTDGKLVEFCGTFQGPKKKEGYFQKHMQSEANKLTKVFAHTYGKTKYPFSNLSREEIPSFFQIMDIIDVTDKSQTIHKDIKVKIFHKIKENKTEYAFLCHFDSNEWKAVDWAKINNGEAIFNSMVVDNIYLPAYYKDGNYTPAGHPIYLNSEGEIVVLKPDLKNIGMVKLYRKYGMGHSETSFSELMVGGKFEGANNKDFKDANELFTIKTKSTHSEKVKTISNQKFQYVRYSNKGISDENGNNRMHVSSLIFYNEYNKKIEGVKIASKSLLGINNVKNAFDDNIRTNFNSDIKCWIGLDFGRPFTINKIKYLFRNSFNTIEPGHKYELFYWNNAWKSLGVKKAVKENLDFEAPENSLLLLRNYTKGKDEMVFFIKNGKQIFG